MIRVLTTNTSTTVATVCEPLDLLALLPGGAPQPQQQRPQAHGQQEQLAEQQRPKTTSATPATGRRTGGVTSG